MVTVTAVLPVSPPSSSSMLPHTHIRVTCETNGRRIDKKREFETRSVHDDGFLLRTPSHVPPTNGRPFANAARAFRIRIKTSVLPNETPSIVPPRNIRNPTLWAIDSNFVRYLFVTVLFSNRPFECRRKPSNAAGYVRRKNCVSGSCSAREGRLPPSPSSVQSSNVLKKRKRSRFKNATFSLFFLYVYN